MNPFTEQQLSEIQSWLKQQAAELGFAQVVVSNPDLAVESEKFQQWVDQGLHGEMDYLARNHDLRAEPAKLLPETCRVVSFAMDYLPEKQSIQLLSQPDKAYVSRYALGRDYHKLIRKRLTNLGKQLENKLSELNADFKLVYRPFVDSAPVMERQIAEQGGMGWIGKHTLLLNRKHGSWFFLAELFINLPLATEQPVKGHCGKCSACIDICPTQAITGPYQLDARRCISYLTIEHPGSIPVELRSMMGNRIYGCDDCQLVCPWNRFAKLSVEDDFQPRQKLDNAQLLELFQWDEAQFLKNTEGSPIRRAGFERWQRNLAIALGNALAKDIQQQPQIISALKEAEINSTAVVNEHIQWALQQVS
ncbi:tRNA epoxyqueuosine(34) reductase QueG [Pelagibaculum spongiae]|uniref:Epoxyqueuosine reductase n=2 Tax=Pelagibaculum spongiae TaxID=2080658 RepID=A0A2V1H4W9_9GAMM|nr:tRNA epoxyqueuosine(34) reductase QueG [Pelagibaculum spongiae]